MLTLILIALAAPPAASAQLAAAPPARCEAPRITYAGKGTSQAGARKLGELPPAKHYLTVVRQVGGCPEPAVVRSGIGAAPR